MITKGLINGMVMQRGENNLCEAYVESDKDIKTVTVSDEYSTPTIEKVDNKYNELKDLNKDENWVLKNIHKQGYNNIEDIFIAMVKKNRFYIYLY